MSQSYQYRKNDFNACKNVTWQDVIDKINHEYLNNTHKLVSNNKDLPLFVLHNNFYPPTIQSAYTEVKKKYNIEELHIYLSFAKGSLTFGRHCDTMDVIIVQSIGNMSYTFDDGSEVIMNSGDSLFIPKGVYHNPIVFEPRVTLSFSW
jgi:ribosomal protein L16 Arg81 hydroxylase